jgi:hypothetical protein
VPLLTLISQLEEYKLRIRTYNKKLAQVKAAVEVERILLASRADPNVLLSRLKKIQETYKDVVTPDDIQRIAYEQQAFIDKKERDEMTQELATLEACCGGPKTQETILGELKNSAARRIDEVRQIDLSFGARVYQVNRTLVQHIRGLYQLYERSEEDPIFVQMFTWSGTQASFLE